MSLKVNTYLLRISKNRIFYKDCLVERKPSPGEKIFTESNIKFVSADTGQRLGAYKEKRFQNMRHLSAELVVGCISPRYEKGQYDSLCDQMIEDGWQNKLTAGEQVEEFEDMWETLKEPEEQIA